MLSGTAGEDRLPSRPKVVVRRLWEVAAALLLLVTVVGSVSGYFLWRARQEQATRDLQAYLDRGYTPSPDTALLRRLIGNGAPVDLSDNYGTTPLVLAVAGRNVDLIQALLARGANVNARNQRQWTPLTYASLLDDEEPVIHTLLAHGATVDARDATGRTPLFTAVEFQRPGAVRLLAEAKADPNVTLKKAMGGQSVLTAAAESGNTRIIALLLERGADVNKPDARGITPLQWASRSHHPQAARLLQARGARR